MAPSPTVSRPGCHRMGKKSIPEPWTVARNEMKSVRIDEDCDERSVGVALYEIVLNLDHDRHRCLTDALFPAIFFE